jgi:Ca2+-binding EF-hand superfamily protein
MTKLFTESFEEMSKFIFDLYDFDKDGYITKEDIRVVLSYIPLNTKEKVTGSKMKYEK